MSAAMWSGVKDGRREVIVFRRYLGRYMVLLGRQYTGDCYGVRGGDSWVWRLLVTREAK